MLRIIRIGGRWRELVRGSAIVVAHLFGRGEADELLRGETPRDPYCF